MLSLRSQLLCNGNNRSPFLREGARGRVDCDARPSRPTTPGAKRKVRLRGNTNALNPNASESQKHVQVKQQGRAQ